LKDLLLKLIHFGYRQVLCCIFPAAIFLTLAVSKHVDINGLYRYDFILIVCLITQALMLILKLESFDELKVISLFHLIGLGLELYKVKMGSWAYPEPAFTKISGVPLYSGFMYAGVASYICQAWKRLDLRFKNWPKNSFTYPIVILIYFNFFTHHFLPDFRWVITVILIFVFFKSSVTFKVNTLKLGKVNTYRMPLLLSFILIGFFIWIAENISTYFGAWQYPNQKLAWHMVHLSKISSWFLLVIISIVIVANLKKLKYPDYFN
jgi:uncharacterized membrane protein YoaT (DUF817 family)